MNISSILPVLNFKNKDNKFNTFKKSYPNLAPLKADIVSFGSSKKSIEDSINLDWVDDTKVRDIIENIMKSSSQPIISVDDFKKVLDYFGYSYSGKNNGHGKIYDLIDYRGKGIFFTVRDKYKNVDGAVIGNLKEAFSIINKTNGELIKSPKNIHTLTPEEINSFIKITHEYNPNGHNRYRKHLEEYKKQEQKILEEKQARTNAKQAEKDVAEKSKRALQEKLINEMDSNKIQKKEAYDKKVQDAKDELKNALNTDLVRIDNIKSMLDTLSLELEEAKTRAKTYSVYNYSLENVESGIAEIRKLLESNVDIKIIKRKFTRYLKALEANKPSLLKSNNAKAEDKTDPISKIAANKEFHLSAIADLQTEVNSDSSKLNSELDDIQSKITSLNDDTQDILLSCEMIDEDYNETKKHSITRFTEKINKYKEKTEKLEADKKEEFNSALSELEGLVVQFSTLSFYCSDIIVEFEELARKARLISYTRMGKSPEFKQLREKIKEFRDRSYETYKIMQTVVKQEIESDMERIYTENDSKNKKSITPAGLKDLAGSIKGVLAYQCFGIISNCNIESTFENAEEKIKNDRYDILDLSYELDEMILKENTNHNDYKLKYCKPIDLMVIDKFASNNKIEPLKISGEAPINENSFYALTEEPKADLSKECQIAIQDVSNAITLCKPLIQDLLHNFDELDKIVPKGSGRKTNLVKQTIKETDEMRHSSIIYYSETLKKINEIESALQRLKECADLPDFNYQEGIDAAHRYLTIIVDGDNIVDFMNKINSETARVKELKQELSGHLQLKNESKTSLHSDSKPVDKSESEDKISSKDKILPLETEKTKNTKKADKAENTTKAKESKAIEKTSIKKTIQKTYKQKTLEVHSDFAKIIIQNIVNHLAGLPIEAIIRDIDAQVEKMFTNVELAEIENCSPDRFKKIIQNKVDSIVNDNEIKNIRRAQVFAIADNLINTKKATPNEVYKTNIKELREYIYSYSQNSDELTTSDFNEIQNTYSKYKEKLSDEEAEKLCKLLDDCIDNITDEQKDDFKKSLLSKGKYFLPVLDNNTNKNLVKLLIELLIKDFDSVNNTNHSQNLNNILDKYTQNNLKQEKINTLNNFDWKNMFKNIW